MFRLLLLTILTTYIYSQEFVRSEIETETWQPFELLLSPDNELWFNEFNGTIYRINKETGEKELVFMDEDHYIGGNNEYNEPCQAYYATGNKGLALHPEFQNPDKSFIYFYDSYNAGSEENPITRFKLCRVKWDQDSKTATDYVVLQDDFPSGIAHIGGRLIIVEENGKYYIYLSVGDTANTWDFCYGGSENNPNRHAQNPDFKLGKIHRFNIDGSIPNDNPIPGNSFWSRGHRNPQGLVWNHKEGILYDVEHGDHTDDEVNIIHKGANYGWPNIHGYVDENVVGETEYYDNYQPNEQIENDMLVEPLYSFCLEIADNNETTCTVAPSDAKYYYFEDGIPEFNNSILIVTLKRNGIVNQNVIQLKLNEDGTELAESTEDNPNPKYWFAEDELINGRLRDIEFSQDGKTIYLINNGGAETNNIITYTYTGPSTVNEGAKNYFYPNPVNDYITITQNKVKNVSIFNITGNIVFSKEFPESKLNISELISGYYIIEFDGENGKVQFPFIKN